MSNEEIAAALADLAAAVRALADNAATVQMSNNWGDDQACLLRNGVNLPFEIDAALERLQALRPK